MCFRASSCGECQWGYKDQSPGQARPGRRDEALKGADGSHHGHNIAKYIPGSRWSEQNTSSEFIILSVFWHFIDSHHLNNVYPR